MKSQFIIGCTPYEIGDKVELKSRGFSWDILDIRMIQYLLKPKIVFEVQVNDIGWISIDEIERRIE